MSGGDAAKTLPSLPPLPNSSTSHSVIDVGPSQPQPQPQPQQQSEARPRPSSQLPPQPQPQSQPQSQAVIGVDNVMADAGLDTTDDTGGNNDSSKADEDIPEATNKKRSG